MKILLYTILGLLVIISLYFVSLSVSSRKLPELGILGDQLRSCPITPNCVCSEFQSNGAFIEPLRFSANDGDAWDTAKKTLIEAGGEIVTERDGYMHVQFVTSFMRYVDDVELRMDDSKQLIHIRSASRVGHSDMGANRARVEKIRKIFIVSSGLN